MPKKASVEPTLVAIQAPQMKEVTITVVGDAPLVTHRMSEKAKKEIRDKQQGRSRGPRENKDPKAEYEAAFHLTADGKPGVPALSFKRALVNACTFLRRDLPKTVVRGVVFVPGDVLPLNGGTSQPEMREDVVRVGGKGGPGTGTADLRYRPIFEKWSVDVPVLYDSSLISLEQVVALMQRAGQNVGICEGRPEKTDMGWGRFHVASESEKSAPAPKKPRAGARA